jgi:exonuclease III
MKAKRTSLPQRQSATNPRQANNTTEVRIQSIIPQKGNRETHFTKQSYIKFRGYKVYRYHTIHPEYSARGGSAIIINKNIHHHKETKYETEGIQATAICMKTRNCSVVVAGIYCPPEHPLTFWHPSFTFKF